jgi:hypothetical protein
MLYDETGRCVFAAARGFSWLLCIVTEVVDDGVDGQTTKLGEALPGFCGNDGRFRGQVYVDLDLNFDGNDVILH